MPGINCVKPPTHKKTPPPIKDSHKAGGIEDRPWSARHEVGAWKVIPRPLFLLNWQETPRSAVLLELGVQEEESKELWARQDPVAVTIKWKHSNTSSEANEHWRFPSSKWQNRVYWTCHLFSDFSCFKFWALEGLRSLPLVPREIKQLCQVLDCTFHMQTNHPRAHTSNCLLY